MIRALITDDEEWVRLGLREQVDWNTLGIEIAGEASNVDQAIELIEKLRPEIVLTDMRMPKRGGVDLLDYLYHRHPEVVAIVISGYSEFEYAQKAISYRAFDYLLKPIEEEQLKQVLENAVEKIHTDRSQLELGMLRSKYVQNDRQIRDKFLTELFQGIYVKPTEWSNYPDDAEIFFSAAPKRVLVFEVVNFQEIVENVYENDSNLASYALFNMLDELMNKNGRPILFCNSGRQSQLLAVMEIPNFPPSVITAYLNEASETVRQLSGFNLYISVSDPYQDAKDAGNIYRHMAKSLSDIGLISPEGIAFAEGFHEERGSFTLSDEKRKAILVFIQSGSSQNAHSVLEAVFTEIESGK